MWHGITYEKFKCPSGGAEVPDVLELESIQAMELEDDGAWGTSDSVHIIKGKKCVQLSGKSVKNVKHDEYFAKKTKKYGMTLQEGSCVDSGYKTEQNHHS